MDYYRGKGSPKFISFRSDREMDGQPLQEQSEEMDTSAAPATHVAELETAPNVPNSGSIVGFSPTSDDTQCCRAYFTRKMEALGTEHSGLPNSVNPVDEEKLSESEPKLVTPGVNYADLLDNASEEISEVTFSQGPIALLPATSVQHGANERKVSLPLTLLYSERSQLIQEKTLQMLELLASLLESVRSLKAYQTLGLPPMKTLSTTRVLRLLH